ncbi:MAG: hypothetical protein ACTSPL_08120 [Candidatus Odinarchaeia archaeon]
MPSKKLHFIEADFVIYFPEYGNEGRILQKYGVAYRNRKTGETQQGPKINLEDVLKKPEIKDNYPHTVGYYINAKGRGENYQPDYIEKRVIKNEEELFTFIKEINNLNMGFRRGALQQREISEEVRKIVKENVLSTGYPLEIETASTLKNYKWNVMLPTRYHDLDEEKWRDLDIKAYKDMYLGDIPDFNGEYQLECHLVIQCKKSSKYAWVFFPTYGSHSINISIIDFFKVARVQSLVSSSIKPFTSLRQLAAFHKFDPMIFKSPPLLDKKVAQEVNWLSSIIKIDKHIFQSIKNIDVVYAGKEVNINKKLDSKQKRRREIFEEAVTLAKARYYEGTLISSFQHDMLSSIKEMAWLSKVYGKFKIPFVISLIFPVIVFDGYMYIWSNNDIKPVNSVIYLCDYRSPFYHEDCAVIIVKKEEFPNFLKKLEKDLENIKEHLKTYKDKLDENTKKIINGIQISP